MVESVITVPAAAAARAMPSSPSGCASFWNATGATSDGHREPRPVEVDRGVDGVDVHEHARDQLPLGERGDVAAQRALVPGAPGEVPERPGLEHLGGNALEVGDVEERTRGPTSCGCSGRLCAAAPYCDAGVGARASGSGRSG